ncbi:MAG: AMP-binding protein [Pseudomonadota bacterium]
MSLWQVLVDGKDLDKVAIDAPDAKLTYAGLIDAAAVAAEALSHRGLRPGDRVAYLGLNSAALVVLVFACARAGLILVPLNWRLAAEELSWILEDADPALIVADPVHWDVARAISAHREITQAHPFAVRRG